MIFVYLNSCEPFAILALVVCPFFIFNMGVSVCELLSQDAYNHGI